MRLSVPIPGSWKQKTVRDGLLCVSPEGDLALLVTPMFPAAADPAAWLCRALTLADDERCETRRAETIEGWPMTILEPEDDLRMAVYVQVLDFAGGVIVKRKPSAARLGWRQEVLRMLTGARPDWFEEDAVCLAEQLGVVVGGAQ